MGPPGPRAATYNYGASDGAGVEECKGGRGPQATGVVPHRVPKGGDKHAAAQCGRDLLGGRQRCAGASGGGHDGGGAGQPGDDFLRQRGVAADQGQRQRHAVKGGGGHGVAVVQRIEPHGRVLQALHDLVRGGRGVVGRHAREGGGPRRGRHGARQVRHGEKVHKAAGHG